MKIVIAPDSYKGTLTAREAAAAMGRGVTRVLPDAGIDLCPMADGGEGTVEAMVAATAGALLETRVTGPLGQPTDAVFGTLGGADGSVAVLEMAAASGLPLIPRERRDPLRTTSYGTGELIRAALDTGASGIILGIGGSATVDGGAGCLQALGVRFLDACGVTIFDRISGGLLSRIAEVDVSGLDPRLAEVGIRVACDVESPLLGPDGAAAVFGPQKGASPKAVRELEAGLTNLARVGNAPAHVDRPGAGAAGGLGFGLLVWLGAPLTLGLPLVAEAVGFEERLAAADLCITGEGRLDAQSSRGKTAAGVATIARSLGVPVICIPGVAAPDAPVGLFDRVHPIVGPGVGLEDARAHPEPWLGRRAAEVAAGFTGL